MTHTSVLGRERERCLVITSVSALIPGRHRDESKLCLTNPLVLRSLHGGLACTADALSDQRQYFFLYFLSSSLPPRHSCTAAAQLFIPKGSSDIFSVFFFFTLSFFLKKSQVVCVFSIFACVQVQEVVLTNMQCVFIRCCPCAFRICVIHCKSV